MKRAAVTVGLAIAMAGVVFGQAAEAPISFEVASVKPAEPPPDGKLMIRMRVDAGRLDYANASLKAMIQRAYRVLDYQVSGPEWIDSTRFNVVAKLPAGAPAAKVPEMLQTLLAERFKLAVHRDTRALPVYALVVGKNGPKLKAAQPDPNAPPKPAPVPGAKAVVEGWFLMNRPGHVEGHGMNMASLVNVLGSLLGRPVVDQTGLKGNYDFDLDFAPDDAPRSPPAGGDGPIPTASTPNALGPALLSAVQSQLGLKLENAKGPVEQIVVDHVEKSPTEN